MDGRPGCDVMDSSPQPDWTIAKRSASPIDVDTRSPKRPPAPWPTFSSGGKRWPPGADDRRIPFSSQVTNVPNSYGFNFAYEEKLAALHCGFSGFESHDPYQHYPTQESAYSRDQLRSLNHPPVTLRLSPDVLGSSTAPHSPTSHIASSSLSNATKNASVPSGPGSSGDPGAHRSHSFCAASSFPVLRMTDNSLSHLSSTTLVTTANPEFNLPVESQAAPLLQTLAYHDPDHHDHGVAFHAHGWPHTASSPLDPSVPLVDVLPSPSAYVFPHPDSYQAQSLGASPLSPFEQHHCPPYCSPPSDTKVHVNASSTIGCLTRDFTEYTTPLILAANDMFYITGQETGPGGQTHKSYVQLGRPGQDELGRSENVACPGGTGEAVLSNGDILHDPAYPGFPQQPFPPNPSSRNPSFAVHTTGDGPPNSLCSDPARSGNLDGYPPKIGEGGGDFIHVAGRTDNELMVTQPERKKRGTFDQDKREKVNKTRKRGACLVCKMQRNECTPNKELPDDPDAPCMRCLRVSISTSKKVVYRVPCVRSTISQLVLHRPGGLGLTRRWDGAKAKDVGDWADDTIRTIHMWQGLSLPENPIIVRVRKFRPKEGDVLCRGPKPLEPYCLADVEQTAKYFDDYLKRNAVHACTNSCLDHLGICRSTGLEQTVKESHPLVRDTYAMAVHHATKSLPDAIAKASGATKDRLEHEQRFLLQAIKFIYAIKHMSGSVRIVGKDKLNMESTADPDGSVWLPRMIVAQWDGIQNERILKHLTKNVLSRLDKYLTKKDHRAWFTIYLVVFIFLHEVSVASKDRQRWARENASLFSWSLDARHARYGSGKLGRFVEHLQASTNILLAHWEYYKSGVDLQSFDWEARHELSQLGSLNQQQANFVRSTVATMQEEDHKIPKTPEDYCWEHELYFISHMFSRHEKALETFNYLEPRHSS